MHTIRSSLSRGIQANYYDCWKCQPKKKYFELTLMLKIHEKKMWEISAFQLYSALVNVDK